MPKPENSALPETASSEALSSEPKDSYVKLAMRNMVKKRGTSLFHFALTTFGVLAALVGLSVAFH
ncbi:DUF3285 domain-containing protein [Leptolyngbya sp. FACHB-261]|nr:DUF3285 domain-containing protein [Leptolyngbya sp. FACHB-261]